MALCQWHVVVIVKTGEVVIVAFLHPAIEIGGGDPVREIEYRMPGFKDGHRRILVNNSYGPVHLRRVRCETLSDVVRLLVLHDQRSAVPREVQQASIVGDESRSRLRCAYADYDCVEL